LRQALLAELADLPWSVRAWVRSYPWRRINPVPWTRPAHPLAASRVALVSSAGLTLPDQEPFDPDRVGGDPSFRLIPAAADVSALGDSQRSSYYDHRGVQTDPNLAMPLDRLHELAAYGRIGSVAPRHVSLMGSITVTGPLIRRTAPAIASLLRGDGVDVALLVPV
jgi:D-proline reductase (dithiol) PrdB